MNAYDVIRKPLVTEKSNIGREAQNLVTFAVDPHASKPEIRNAVEQLFSVKVLDVRTLRMPRKSRRVGKTMGYKPRWKKAVVRLAEGQRIEFFEGV
ncbi:MAG: 50S ribosomal protein L23 [Deltaproteobacteria bacterium]|nr:50S ribosomal protein L23 [Deltaproteobacteria bacterium]